MKKKILAQLNGFGLGLMLCSLLYSADSAEDLKGPVFLAGFACLFVSGIFGPLQQKKEKKMSPPMRES